MALARLCHGNACVKMLRPACAGRGLSSLSFFVLFLGLRRLRKTRSVIFWTGTLPFVGQEPYLF